MDENNIITENTEETERGTVKISEDVVSIIAGMAASGIEGVYSMSGTITGGLVELFGVKKNATKGIKVEIDDRDVTIDIHITVIYGYKIPDIAWEIQEKVKEGVESATGLNVLKVNIHVDGINMEKPKKEAEEEAAEVIEAPAEPEPETEENDEE